MKYIILKLFLVFIISTMALLFLFTFTSTSLLAEEIMFTTFRNTYVRLIIFDTNEPLSNVIFKISPNPFTLNGLLIIQDNNKSVDFNSSNGIIFLKCQICIIHHKLN